MASKIVPLIPPHTVYCEPFAGGAAVFYAKPKPCSNNQNDYTEVLNDLNGHLVSMYREAQQNPNQFSRYLKATPFSAFWYNWAKMVLDSGVSDQKTSAVAKYVAHNQGFAAKSHGGFSRQVIGNKASFWNNKTLHSKESCDRLRNVVMDNVDAIKIIENYDSPHTFFYIDPPYLGTCLGEMGQWSPQDLQRLIKCLNMAQGSFILSGYDNHMVPIRGAVSHEFLAYCSVDNARGKVIPEKTTHTQTTNDKKRMEVVWMRGPAAPVRKSIIPVLQKQTCFTGPLLGPCPLPLAR